MPQACRDEPVEVGFASGAALVVRRTAWEAVGGFDPDYFMYGEDLDLSLRLRLAGWGVGVARRRASSTTTSSPRATHKWFQLERNRWWTVLGAYPAALLALLAPALLLSELALLAVAGRGGWLGAKLRAQRAVLRTLPMALRRRRRSSRTAETARDFAASLTASLDSPFLGPAAQVTAIRTLQAGYWRAVRSALGV